MPLDLQSLKGGVSTPEQNEQKAPAAAPAAEPAKPTAKRSRTPRTRTARPRLAPADVYVATTSGSAQGKKGDVYMFIKGVTRVAAGHELLKLCPDYFEPVEDRVHYDNVTRG